MGTKPFKEELYDLVSSGGRNLFMFFLSRIREVKHISLKVVKFLLDCLYSLVQNRVSSYLWMN